MTTRDDDSTLIEPPSEAVPAGPEAAEARRLDLRDLPKEVGVLLFSAGVLGVILPGPGTPAVIAGGLVLWPDQFGKAEDWFRRRFPKAHQGGMRHIHRFLDDMERRYPGTTQ